jgi:ubiquinone/menaquinone biosynthesis C-methylase UbiE
MEEVGTYHNEKSEDYDQVFDTLYFKVFDFITWKYLEPYIPTRPDALVLDAAGGTGRWAVKMARKNCKIVLIAMSQGMLETAAEKIKKEHMQNKITIEKRDIKKTGFADETFDMILCEHALFLFEDPAVVVKELVNILKKDARLIISAQNRYVQSLASLSGKPSLANLERAYEILVSKSYECMTESGEVKVYTWTPNEFQKILQAKGLRVEKIVGKGITMPLRIRKETYWKKDYPEALFNKILEFELAVCERQDALSLAGHLQAITRKL